MSFIAQAFKDIPWLNNDHIRPYILTRPEHIRFGPPFDEVKNFEVEPLFIDPLRLENLSFCNALLNVENVAFSKSNMTLPRWALYDCALLPSYISGFACHTSHLTENMKKIIGEEHCKNCEWLPLSLFITVPSMDSKSWVAHNLSSINVTLPKEERLYALGFLTKAFSLSYANIEKCIGVTQWNNAAMALHSHYGYFELLTAYTPVHDYPNTLTYRVVCQSEQWPCFLNKQKFQKFYDHFEHTGKFVTPSDENSIKALHQEIEQGEGPYYLDGYEIRTVGLDKQLKIYSPK